MEAQIMIPYTSSWLVTTIKANIVNPISRDTVRLTVNLQLFNLVMIEILEAVNTSDRKVDFEKQQTMLLRNTLDILY